MTSSRPTDPDLLKLTGLHRAGFEQAKILQARVEQLAVAVAALGAVSVLLRNSSASYLIAGVSLACLAAGRALSWRSQHTRAAAERGRRALVLTRSLGWQLCGKEKADLIADITASPAVAEMAKRFEDPGYYTPVPAAGAAALATTLEESAFWSKELLKVSGQGAWILFAGVTALLFLALLSLPFLHSSDTNLLLARVLCVCFTSVVALDLFGIAHRYSGAATRVADVDTRLHGIITSECHLADVVNLFCDYNSTVEGAPLIPTKVYERHHRRLDQLWKQHRQESDTPSP